MDLAEQIMMGRARSCFGVLPSVTYRCGPGIRTSFFIIRLNTLRHDIYMGVLTGRRSDVDADIHGARQSVRLSDRFTRRVYRGRHRGTADAWG